MTVPRVNGQDGPTYGQSDSSLLLSEDIGYSKRGTALSNKLTSVLSSSYTDTEVRDALRLLDAHGLQNGERHRSNLKYDAQEEVIRANAKIVDDFGKVAKQLQRVGALISILNQTCDDMRSHIQIAKQETFPTLEEAGTLLARKEETESKQQLLEAFKTHFLVSDEDLTTLTSSAEPVSDRYFVVLARVKQIHKDCEILLGYENQRLGLEMMEQTGRNLDAGYKKLYGWIQREFKGLDLEDPRTSGSIRKSLRALSERPTLFQNCLDLFGEAREVTLSDGFQTALTDSTIGSAKAIEFSTHDPLRYIGDMLAWVHSATVSEKEALEGLFISDADEISKGLHQGKSSEPWARIQQSGDADDDSNIGDQDLIEQPAFDGRTALNSLISRNMASVSQTLQQRISLAIRNLTEPLPIYKAYNLLTFYEDIFVKLLGIAVPSPEATDVDSRANHVNTQNSLLTCLFNLQSQALSLFENALQEDLDSQSTSANLDLSPPAFLLSHLTLLSSVLTLRAPNLTTKEFTDLYGIILTPVLEACTELAESLGPDDSSSEDEVPTNEDQDSQNQANFETTLFKLNFLNQITTTFTNISTDKTLSQFITPPLQHAYREISTLQSHLADLLKISFLHTSALSSLLDLSQTHRTLNHNSEPTSLQTIKQTRTTLLSNNTLENAATALDTFLASALMDAQDDLTRLNDKSTAKAVINQAVEEFCVEFEKVVQWIELMDRLWIEEVDSAGGKVAGEDDDDDGDGNNEEDEEENMKELLLRDVYPRTTDEVRALLN